MGRLLLLLAALVAGVSSFVYTCNEAKQIMENGTITIAGTRACVVLPASVKFPFNDDPYSWYLYNTYLLDTASGMQWELSGFEEDGSFCKEGAGPWMIKSDDEDRFTCSSNKYKYAEIIFLFTSEDPNVVQTSATPVTAKFSKGTHVFVAPEGSLLIEKKGIDDGKETTLQFYSGAGANEQEERVALMPEKFVAGTSTVIIGPVTTLVIEDDVTVELTLTSFQDSKDISAQPGFSFSLMTTGRANDLQSSRPSIKVSTAYGIDDDSIAYDSLSITGTAKIDDEVATVVNIECFQKDKGETALDTITETRDIIINRDCSTLEITYKGSLEAEDIGRSSEVIYLRIDSNSDPVLEPVSSEPTPPKPTGSTDPTDPDATEPPVTLPTRRTMPPTTARTTHSTSPGSSTASRLPSSTTKMTTTTSAASGISILSAALFIALLGYC